MIYPRGQIRLDLSRPRLALVLNVEQEVDEGIRVVHPAYSYLRNLGRGSFFSKD
jgi:hypothetical protein